jgi:hypothetical protein
VRAGDRAPRAVRDAVRPAAQVAPFDGAARFGTDPSTILPTAPVRIENTCTAVEHVRRAALRTFSAAYPSRRFRSTWIALASHTAPSVLVITVVLFLVL